MKRLRNTISEEKNIFLIQIFFLILYFFVNNCLRFDIFCFLDQVLEVPLVGGVLPSELELEQE